MTRNLARVLLGLPGFFILATGVVFVLNPAAASAKLLLTADSAEALSNLRGMMGAPLVAVGGTLVLGAITAKLEYARPAAIFLLTLIGARILSFFVDGPNPSLVLYLVVPSIAFGLMVAGHVLLDRSNA